jgi:hypothetical protein
MNPVDIFHAVEFYLTEKHGFRNVRVVDPEQMPSGYLLAWGVNKEGKAVCVKVTREALTAFAEEKKSQAPEATAQ